MVTARKLITSDVIIWQLAKSTKNNGLMDKRQQLSGSAKRKLKKDKEKIHLATLQKIPQICSFFSRGTADHELPGGCTEVKIASIANDGANVSSAKQSSSDTDDIAEQSSITAPREPQQREVTVSQRLESSCTQSQVEIETEHQYTVPVDSALWGPITARVREEAIQHGPAVYQNRAAKYPASIRDCGIGGRTRSLTNDLLHSRLQNDEIVPRQWLLYSPSTGLLYCYARKLFSSQSHAFINGFCDWKHPERISDHEKSVDH